MQVVRVLRQLLQLQLEQLLLQWVAHARRVVCLELGVTSMVQQRSFVFHLQALPPRQPVFRRVFRVVSQQRGCSPLLGLVFHQLSPLLQ
jgi:hypothetical protein